MKKIAITQSNYIPWIGYFELIDYVDEFIFFDEVQHTRRDWRNRNKIQYQGNVKWLTIPLKSKGNYFKKISEIMTYDNKWKIDHINKIYSYYRKFNDFEKIEILKDSGEFSSRPPGKFEKKQTFRKSKNGEDGGGGIMSVMRDGRVFEKVGVNVSTVYGNLEPLAQKSLSSRHNIPGLKEDPQFWASGISLVAHMQSPKTPAVHMNTRMFWTKGMSWFGGGSDLNPMVENEEDTRYFHNELKKVCDKANKEYYTKFKIGQVNTF